MGSPQPDLAAANALFRRGTIALAELERNGMGLDLDYLQSAIESTKTEIARLKKELRQTEVWELWKKRFGKKTNMGSGDQLGAVIFKEMGYKPKKFTATGKPSTAAEDLGRYEIPFVKDYTRIAKLEKALGTYLEPIFEKQVNGRIHCVFGLWKPQSYRSSAEDPNLQNVPVRDPDIGKLIRSAFKARRGWQMVETDYKGAEVCVSACYHKDPVMLDYLADETKDMHRDMAAQCFISLPEQVSKIMRYCGKNMFVFPEFYGDWFANCADNQWDMITRQGLLMADGVTLVKDHLRSKGITKLGDAETLGRGTFMAHMKKVEEHFWQKRFRVYNQWKEKSWRLYQQRGWFPFYTGFVCNGVHNKKEVCNYPIQGSAFHCLLWALCEILREIKIRKMPVRLTGQIHDSIVAEVKEGYVDDYLQLVHEIVTVRLPAHWDWIITKIDVEAEVVPPGMTWYDKKEYQIAA